MAFSTSSISIEQVTFDMDDSRCDTQNISSFDSLVNYDSEFPPNANVKLANKRKTKATSSNPNETSASYTDNNNNNPTNNHQNELDDLVEEPLSDAQNTNRIISNLQNSEPNNVGPNESGQTDNSSDRNDHAKLIGSLNETSLLYNDKEDNEENYSLLNTDSNNNHYNFLNDSLTDNNNYINNNNNNSRSNLIKSVLDEMNSNSNNFTFIPDAKELQRSILGDSVSSKNVDLTSFDVEKVLIQAQEILKNVAASSSNEQIASLIKSNLASSTMQQQQPAQSTYSNNANIDQTTANTSNLTESPDARASKMDGNKPTPPSNQRSHHKSKSKSTLSRANSVSSLNVFDESAYPPPPHHHHQHNGELEQLKEENELLNIKINKLRYDLKLRDTTVDDLKEKIAQMYVDLDTCQMSKKQTELDVETLKAEMVRLNGEKLSYFDNLKQLMSENESYVKRLQTAQLQNADQAARLEKLKSEKEHLNKECIETKMRAIKEKEELVKHLEKIENDIIKRERDMYTKQYEKLLVEACESLQREEAKRHQAELKRESELIRHEYQREIDSLKEIQAKNEKQLREQQELLMSKLSDDLKSQFEHVTEAKLNEYAVEKSQLEQRITSLQQELNEAKASLDKEIEKSNDKNAEIINLNKQKFKLMAQIKQLQKEKEEETAPKSSGDLDNEYKQKYNELVDQWNKVNKEVEIINRENESLKKTLSEYHTTSDLLGKQISEEQKLNEMLANNLEEWKRANKAMELEIINQQTLNKQLTQGGQSTDSDQKYLQLLDEYNKLDTRKLQLECDLVAVRNELDSQKAMNKKQNSQLEDEIAQSRDLNTVLRANLAEWEANNRQLEEKLIQTQQAAPLSSSTDNQQEQINELYNNQYLNDLKKIEELNLKYDYLNELKAQCDRRIEELTIENGQLKEKLANVDQNNDHSDKLSQIGREKEQLQIDYTNLLTQLDSLKIENEKLVKTSKLEMSNVEIERLENEILQSQELNKQLNENLLEWQNANSTVEQQILLLQEKNNQLNVELIEKQAAQPNDQIQQQLAQLRNDYVRLEAVKNELDLKNSQLTIEIDRLKSELDENVQKQTVSNVKSTGWDDFESLNLNTDNNDNALNSLQVKNQDLLAKIQQIEKEILENQELNRKLNENLVEWQTTNQTIEREILLLQEKNVQLGLDQSNLTADRTLAERLEIVANEKRQLESTIGELNEEIFRLQDNLRVEISSKQELFQQNSQLKVDNESANSIVRELREKIDQIHVQQSSDKSVEISNNQNPNETLGERLISSIQADEMVQLQKLNGELNENLHEWNNTNKLVEEAILQAQNLNSKLVENLNVWQVSNQDIETKINDLQSTNVSLTNQLITLQQQPQSFDVGNVKSVEHKETLTEEFASTFSGLEEKFNQLEMDFNKLDTSKLQLECDLIATRNELELERIKTNDLEKLKSEITDVKQMNEKSIARINELELLNSSLSNDLNTIRNELTDRGLHSDETLSQLLFNVKQQEEKIVQCQELNQKLNENLLEWTKTNENIEAQIIIEQQKYQSLNDNLNSVKSNENQVELIDNLRSEIERLKMKNSVNEIQQQNDELNKKIQELTIELEKLIEEKENLVINSNNTQLKLDSVDNEKQKLQIQNMDLLVEVDSLKIENQDLIENNKLLTKQNQLETDNSALAAEIQRIENEILQSQELNKQLNENFLQWTDTNQTLEQQILLLQDKNNELNEKLSQLKQQTEASGMNLDVKTKLENQLSEMSQNYANLEQNSQFNKSELEAQIEKLKSENERLLGLQKESELKTTENPEKSKSHGWDQFETIDTNDQHDDTDKQSLIDRISQLESELAQQTSQNELVDSLKEKISQLESAQDLTKQNTDLTTEIQRIENEILQSQDLNKQLNENLLEWQNANSTVEQQILLQEKNNQLNVQLIEKQASQVNDQPQTDQLDEQNHQILHELAQLKDDLSLLKSVKEELELKNNQLTLEIDTLRSEINEASKKETVTNVKSSGGWDDFEPITTQNDDQQNNIQPLQNEINLKDTKIQQLNDDLLDRENRISILENQISDLHAQNQLSQEVLNQKDQMETDLEHLKDDYTRLETAKNDLDIKNNQLTIEIDGLRSELDDLSKKETVTNVKSSGGWDDFEPITTEPDNEKEALLTKINQLETDISDLKSTYSDLVQNLEQQNNVLRSEIQKLQNELVECQSSIQHLQTSDYHHSNLTQIINENSLLKEEITQTSHVISSLKLTNQQLEDKIASNVTQFTESDQNSQKQLELCQILLDSHRKLIFKLESHQQNLSQIYEKIISYQKLLIVQLEKKYNDVLHSLIDSFDDIESNKYETNVEEIQSDLNNLIHILNQIKDNESIERPLADIELSPHSLKSIKFLLNEHLDRKHSSTTNSSLNRSFNEEDEQSFVPRLVDASHLKELFKQNSLNTSLLLNKSDFECQCNLVDESYLVNDLLESNKQLSAKLDAKQREVENLKNLIKILQQNDQPQVKTSQTDSVRSLDASFLSPTSSQLISHHDNQYEILSSSSAPNTNQESDGLKELIINYMNLIKSYKVLLARLDQAKVDNSQLKVAYNLLNSKYLRLKSNKDDDADENNVLNVSIDQVFAEESLDEDTQKCKEQLANLKHAYDKFYELYMRMKNDSHVSYNRLHDAYMNKISDNSNDGIIKKFNLVKIKLKSEKEKNSQLLKEIDELKEERDKSTKIKNESVEANATVEKLNARLQSEQLQNDLLKQKLNEHQMQIDLANSKITNLNEKLQQKEVELEMSKKTNPTNSNLDISNNLSFINKSLIDECESLKKELSQTRTEKLELETTVEDLKRTLKLTEKESQVN